MSKLVVITDRELAVGFQLAGVEVREARSADEAGALIRQIAHSGEYALAVVNQPWLQELDAATAELVEESSEPLVLPLPTRLRWDTPLAAEEAVSELVRSVAGFHIRLGG